jgi:hypothetical protein
MKRICLIGILAFVGGCATVGDLVEPKDIPSIVKSYRIEALEARTGDVATMLDLDECTESAVLMSVGLSGVPSVAGHFPVRQLVAREFQKVVVGNFRTVMPEEEPKLEVRIVSDRLSVKRNWSRVTAEMVFEVQLVDPEHSRRPYFRKNYRLSAESVQRRKEEVPLCVYSCIQNLARDFLEDVSKDSLVIARLKALGGE